jgi:Flp pilus assembly secretin CpaC
MMAGPYTWTDLGGPGTAVFDPARGELVVSNTAAVHAGVADLLDALRRLQEKTTAQVVIETRLIEAPEAFFKSVGWDAETLVAGNTPVVHLTDGQAKRMLEALQTDPRVNVMAAPRMTTCDGQPAVCRVGQSLVFQTGLELTAGPAGVARAARYEAVEVGTRFAATSTVSADRRFVKVRFQCETAAVGKAVPVTPVVVAGGQEASPDVLSRPAVDRQVMAAETTLPDGGTALIAGPVCVREERIEHRLPVLSNVPHLDRLFVTRAVGRVEVRQVVLLTARVVPTEKEGCQLETTKCAELPAPCCPRVEKPTSPTDVSVQAVKPAGECKSCGSLEAANLVKAYRKACADGKTEEALKLAMQALALDPQCFAGK